MGKIFNLKEWLTVADAARHLSIVFGEDVTEADVLRLALDKRIRLSVNFVNGAAGRVGRIVPIDEAEYEEIPSPSGKGTLRLYGGPQLFLGGRTISVVKLEEEVRQLRGIYDLPMIGSEQLDVEHEYQRQVGGPPVTLVGMDGAFVEGRNGLIAQIQDDRDDSPYQNGSTAQLEMLRQRIADNNLGKEEAEALLKKYSEDRKEYLERRSTQTAAENHYPRDGLPADSMFVVRTEALREFEQSVNPVALNLDKPMTTSERNSLLTIIAALCDHSAIKLQDRGAASQIAKMTEEIGASVSDDTVRRALAKIPSALESRMK